MHPMKRYAAGLLVGAMVLALLTPWYIPIAVPGTRVYHRNGFVLVTQTLPYLLCAALWLPWKHPSTPKVAFRLSLLLFVAACLLYVPIFIDPRMVGGDMVGLGYILVCLVTTGAVLAISLITFGVLFVRGVRRP